MRLQKIIFFLWILISLNSLANATMYEDAEDNNTNGWSIYDNTPAGATISVVYDNNSNVIDLNGSGLENGYILGSFDDDSSWKNTHESILKWDMESNESYTIYIRLKTTKGYRYLYYTATDVNYGIGNNIEFIHHGLGVGSIDGVWHSYSRDLEADLKEFEPDN